MQTQILIGLFICHFVADYTHLSTSWMLDAKRLGKPFLPILTHAMVHTLLMGIFLGCMGISNTFLLMGLQLITHFIIDVWKGRMNNLFPELQYPLNKWHWIVFGFDQLLHSIIIILMAYYSI
jgi:hypothetical protein